MNGPEPFYYSSSLNARKYQPAGYLDYRQYKEWLRDEFVFRCVYCLFRERWYGAGAACFSVEHLEPKSTERGRDLECIYDNLAYACSRCNSFRGVAIILNPSVAALGQHLRVNEQDGRIESTSSQGESIIRLLKLNHPAIINRRRYSFLVRSLKQEFPDNPTVRELYLHEFGFPVDLPDLRELKPPEGNPRDNESRCYYAQRERGEGPDVY